MDSVAKWNGLSFKIAEQIRHEYAQHLGHFFRKLRIAALQVVAYFLMATVRPPQHWIVAAQWVSRALAALGKNPKIADIIADPKNPLRIALSG